MLRFFRLFCLILVMVSFFTQAKMRLSVVGLSGDLADNVNTRVSLIDPTSINNTPYFKRYLESEIKRALRALGYYSPRFKYQVRKRNNKQILVVIVSRGNPVLIEGLNINIQGEGKQDKEFVELIDNETPKIGDILNHGTYETFKRDLQSLAQRKGYFHAVITKHELAVAEQNNQAYWNIDFNTGERYQFDEIKFHPTEIKTEYLTPLLPFKKGDPYDLTLISVLNQRLSSTNWFNSIVIEPDFSKAEKNKALPIDIITTPRKQNGVDLGIGYSNDNGIISGKINWSKPWINSHGHSFQSGLLTSKAENTLSMSYKIPLQSSPLEDYYTIQSGLKKLNDNDTNSQLYTFGLIRNWQFNTGWQAAVGLNLMYDDFIQANDKYTTMLYYPSVTLYKLHTNDSALTMKGFSQSYSLETASQSLASDIDFLRLQIQHSWVQYIGQYNRLVMRSNISFIESNNFDRVPPTLRFFAGGDRSIRGYAYQSLSPRDNSGKLKGASKLVTGTLEYQYNVTGAWWGAAFFDSGEAVDDWDKPDFYSGAGLGARWTSPIGTIKVDLAVPINHPDSIRLNSIHLYIGLGTEL